MHDVIPRALRARNLVDDAARTIGAIQKPAALRLAEDGLTTARAERARVALLHRDAGLRARDACKTRDDELDRLTPELELADAGVTRARAALKNAHSSSADLFSKATAAPRAAIAERLLEVAASLDDAFASLALLDKGGERFGVSPRYARANIDTTELRAIARRLGAR